MKNAFLNIGFIVLASSSAFAGRFENLQASYGTSTQIDQTQLGKVASFSCTSIDKDDEIEQRTITLLATQIAGTYTDFQNTSACNIVACISYREQTFAINASGELESTTNLVSKASISEPRVIDSLKWQFRQQNSKTLIGQGTRNFFGHNSVKRMMVCEKTALAQPGQ